MQPTFTEYWSYLPYLILILWKAGAKLTEILKICYNDWDIIFVAVMLDD